MSQNHVWGGSEELGSTSLELQGKMTAEESICCIICNVCAALLSLELNQKDVGLPGSLSISFIGEMVSRSYSCEKRLSFSICK